MGWMETLTREAFIAIVREAVRPDFEMLEKRLESEMKGVHGQIKGIEGEIAGMKSQIESLQREIKSNNSILEGKIENIPYGSLFGWVS